MKFINHICIALCAIGLVSCDNDTPFDSEHGGLNTVVSVKATLDVDMRNRASSSYADGQYVTDMVYWLYDVTNGSLVTSGNTLTSGPGWSFDFTATEGHEYSVVAYAGYDISNWYHSGAGYRPATFAWNDTKKALEITFEGVSTDSRIGAQRVIDVMGPKGEFFVGGTTFTVEDGMANVNLSLFRPYTRVNFLVKESDIPSDWSWDGKEFGVGIFANGQVHSSVSSSAKNGLVWYTNYILDAQGNFTVDLDKGSWTYNDAYSHSLNTFAKMDDYHVSLSSWSGQSGYGKLMAVAYIMEGNGGEDVSLPRGGRLYQGSNNVTSIANADGGLIVEGAYKGAFSNIWRGKNVSLNILMNSFTPDDGKWHFNIYADTDGTVNEWVDVDLYYAW